MRRKELSGNADAFQTTIDIVQDTYGGPGQPALAESVLQCVQVPEQASPIEVMIVEDHPINQHAIAQQIESLGYIPRIFSDGLAALRAFERGERFKLVLLDCQLPGIDGYEVAKRIRQFESLQCEYGSLGIIAVSASSGNEHHSRCLDNGMDGVLEKPIQINELAGLLKLWVSDAVPSIPSVQITRNEDYDSRERYYRGDLKKLCDARRSRDHKLVKYYEHRLHGMSLALGLPETIRLEKNL